MNLSAARLQNLLIYSLVCVSNMMAIAIAAALQSGAMPGFRDGEFLAPAKGEAIGLLVLLTPILSGWIAANRPSFGGENLAAQASVLRGQGYHRDEMIVLSPDDAAQALAGDRSSTVGFSDIQIQQLTDELLRRRAAADRAAAAALDDERKAEGRG